MEISVSLGSFSSISMETTTLYLESGIDLDRKQWADMRKVSNPRGDIYGIALGPVFALFRRYAVCPDCGHRHRREEEE